MGPAEGGNAGDAITKPAGCEPSAALRPGLPGYTAWLAGTAASTARLDARRTPELSALGLSACRGCGGGQRAGPTPGPPKPPLGPHGGEGGPSGCPPGRLINPYI